MRRFHGRHGSGPPCGVGSGSAASKAPSFVDTSQLNTVRRHIAGSQF
jgi:hypothetical protein